MTAERPAPGTRRTRPTPAPDEARDPVEPAPVAPPRTRRSRAIPYSTRLDPETIDAIEARAHADGIPMREVVQNALTAYLKL